MIVVASLSAVPQSRRTPLQLTWEKTFKETIQMGPCDSKGYTHTHTREMRAELMGLPPASLSKKRKKPGSMKGGLTIKVQSSSERRVR